MSTTLKRPVGVYFLATLFLLAPIGNILISFAGSGISNWHQPNVIAALLQTIPAIDWLWLGLLFITGLLLFRPHKLSWSVAILALLVVLGINAFRLYNIDTNSIDPIFLKVFSLLAIICTLGVLIIAFYFRFPYLDRRTTWVSNTKRYELKTTALLTDHKAVTESLSMTGCKLIFEQKPNLKLNETYELKFPEVSSLTVLAQLVESSGQEGRMEFVKISSEFKRDIKRWLESR